VTEALLRRMEPFRDRTRTLTADHGKEFAGHREVSAGRDAGFCFATPCHSRERGLNEHAKGLVRQYFPRGTDFRQVTPEQVKQVEDRLNRRPRKALGCRGHNGVISGVVVKCFASTLVFHDSGTGLCINLRPFDNMFF